MSVVNVMKSGALVALAGVGIVVAMGGSASAQASCFHWRPPCGDDQMDPHPTGGGMVARTAHVDLGSRVEVGSFVCGTAQVIGNSVIEGCAIVRGDATVESQKTRVINSTLSGRVLVTAGARVTDYMGRGSLITDYVTVTDSLVEGSTISGTSTVYGDDVFGHPTVRLSTIGGRSSVTLGAFVSHVPSVVDSDIAGRADVQGAALILRSRISGTTELRAGVSVTDSHILNDATVHRADVVSSIIRDRAEVDGRSFVNHSTIQDDAEVLGPVLIFRSTISREGKVHHGNQLAVRGCEDDFFLDGLAPVISNSTVSGTAKVSGRTLLDFNSRIDGDAELQGGRIGAGDNGPDTFTHIGRGVFVAPGCAEIRGPVEMANAFIGPNVKILARALPGANGPTCEGDHLCDPIVVEGWAPTSVWIFDSAQVLGTVRIGRQSTRVLNPILEHSAEMHDQSQLIGSGHLSGHDSIDGTTVVDS